MYAAKEKQLQKHGPFHVPDQDAHTDKHRAAMEGFESEVGGVLSQGCFGGKHIQVVRSIRPKENIVFQDEEELIDFLKLSEQRKSECEQEYKANKNEKQF